MRSYPVKENPIGFAVSEILWYTQTDRQIDILLPFYKDSMSYLFRSIPNLNACLTQNKILKFFVQILKI